MAPAMKKAKQFGKGCRQGMKRFGQTISIIINSVLLTIVYVVGVGLTAVIAKVARKHFLEKKFLPGSSSYWSDLRLGKKDIKEYYRQF
jgi:hypothetical protein